MQIDTQPILEIVNLHVEIAGNEVLKGINLTINPGEAHILFGPNGSGKSTLIKTIMGLSECKVTQGCIRYLGEDVTYSSISDRSIKGMGILFQNPPEISGLPLKTLVSHAFSDVSKETVNELAETTTMIDYLERDLNVGFSGGERKRCEAFQLLLQKPVLSLLDEPESGVDLQSVRILCKALSALQNRDVNGRRSAMIIITHTGNILEYMHGTVAHVLVDGRLSCTGDEKVFFQIIQTDGFDYFRQRVCNNECETCDRHAKHDCMSFDVIYDPVMKKQIDEISSCTMQTDLLDSFMRSSTSEDLMMDEDRLHHETVISPPVSSLLQAMSAVDDTAFYEEAEGEVKVATTGDVIHLDTSSLTSDLYGGNYRQRDQTVEEFGSFEAGIEVLSLAAAMSKYSWFEEKYMWKAMDCNKDEITRAVAENDRINPTGYVIIAHPGAKSVNPVNSQLIMESGHVQYVHNILISMPGSQLTVASTCTFHCESKNHQEKIVGGEHYGVSEFYVETDSQLCFSMIHTWCNSYVVWPRSAAIIDDNGVFYSNYVCLEPVIKVQMCPLAILRGKNAVAKFSSVLLAKEGTTLDIGSRSLLNGEGSRSESITRTISKGGNVYARADIQGNAPNTKGHIECQGLVVNEKQGVIYSIPQISGGFGTELSHEAAIGRIAKEKIEYLMTRRLTEEAAVSVIIRGFLNVKVQGIPRVIQEQMDEIIDQASREGF